ncbi:hypothetical protein [Azospirillum sp. TSO35-2]|uniref:hypothetical protein n=1 Tax=Azospirillum sp. TSO35-2 TaxID=716796 RepID=UPI000D618607|nr:hypothetical protein [Azospirillum sp. TSO35-2]PWC34097.1 hypothetical protein TSO352_27700 [Azospirillum sp. TSO35-2]
MVALLLPNTGNARATSPLDRYLAARDRSIATLNRDTTSDTLSQEEDRARGRLEAMLKAMIGPLSIPGVPGEGRINLQTLLKEQGFGMLDGLAFGMPGDRRMVVATTDGLLAAWLKGHKAWWPGRSNVPQDVKAALRSEDFYTQAISPDSAIALFADLPVTAPGAGHAVALLALARQDIGPWMPDRIILARVHDGRVFIAVESAAVPVAAIPACTAVWRRYETRTQAASATFQASKADEKTRDALFAKVTRLEEEGDRAHRRCFAERLAEQGYFPALVRQAQALQDSLP